MRKLLWIGDAGCPSGFARATHETLDVLRRTWNVEVIGINYRGDPAIDPRRASMPYPENLYPYPIYPAARDGDMFGVRRLRELVPRIGPDVIVIQNDPWNIPEYMKRLPGAPIVAAVAVDGKNMAQARDLNGLALAIFWTQFGLDEARKGGYAGPSAVIPLGVDRRVFYPLNRREARKDYGLPERCWDAFIVGNVNRNQPRKRLDLLVKYFAEWITTRKIDDAYLFLHVAPTGDDGYNCEQLAIYYGVPSRLILMEPEVWVGYSEERMQLTYNCFDIQATTTQGEGFGLPTLEGMACGVPQLVPDWSALGEWPGDAVMKVPCTTTAVTFNNINVVGGIADEDHYISALDTLYRDRSLRAQYAAAGFELAGEKRFQWETIGLDFADAIDQALALKAIGKTEMVHAS